MNKKILLAVLALTVLLSGCFVEVEEQENQVITPNNKEVKESKTIESGWCAQGSEIISGIRVETLGVRKVKIRNIDVEACYERDYDPDTEDMIMESWITEDESFSRVKEYNQGKEGQTTERWVDSRGRECAAILSGSLLISSNC
jgi:protein involved in sex pheromone biosynthesis